jgi:hypothetical protein
MALPSRRVFYTDRGSKVTASPRSVSACGCASRGSRERASVAKPVVNQAAGSRNQPEMCPAPRDD